MKASDFLRPAVVGLFSDSEKMVNPVADSLHLRAFTLKELSRPLAGKLRPLADAIEAMGGERPKFGKEDVAGIVSGMAEGPESDSLVVKVPKGLLDSTGRGGSSFFTAREEWTRYATANAANAPDPVLWRKAVMLKIERDLDAAMSSGYAVQAIAYRNGVNSANLSEILGED